MDPLTLQPVRELLAKALTDPDAAADDLERMASKLMEAARKLRQSGWKSQGGMTDRVQLQVVSPEGDIKQQTDTENKT